VRPLSIWMIRLDSMTLVQSSLCWGISIPLSACKSATIVWELGRLALSTITYWGHCLTSVPVRALLDYEWQLQSQFSVRFCRCFWGGRR
jgi:hypothetical protein